MAHEQCSCEGLSTSTDQTPQPTKTCGRLQTIGTGT